LLPTVVTLNDLERRWQLFCVFFTKFGGFAGFVRFLENACQTWAP